MNIHDPYVTDMPDHHVRAASFKSGYQLRENYHRHVRSQYHPDEKGKDYGANTIIDKLMAKKGAHASYVFSSEDGYCGTSNFFTQCREALQEIVKQGNYSAVSFNWGLHDICPSRYGEVSSHQRASNMRKIYNLLKEAMPADGTIIFQTTTPIPRTPSRRNEDVIAHNEIVRHVASGFNPPVQVHDMYQPFKDACPKGWPEDRVLNKGQCPDMYEDHDVHMTDKGKKLFAKLVVESMLG